MLETLPTRGHVPPIPRRIDQTLLFLRRGRGTHSIAFTSSLTYSAAAHPTGRPTRSRTLALHAENDERRGVPRRVVLDVRRNALQAPRLAGQAAADRRGEAVVVACGVLGAVLRDV